MNHLFGPVPSRRLGLSLGVDLLPFKTCTLDCVYCQLAPLPIEGEAGRRPQLAIDAVEVQVLKGRRSTPRERPSLRDGTGPKRWFMIRFLIRYELNSKVEGKMY